MVKMIIRAIDPGILAFRMVWLMRASYYQMGAQRLRRPPRSIYAQDNWFTAQSKTTSATTQNNQPTTPTKCVFSFPSSSSTSWESGLPCHPSFPTAVVPTIAPAARTPSSHTSQEFPPSSPAPPSARTRPSASTSRTTWTGTGTTRAPVISSPPAPSRGRPTVSGCLHRSPAYPRSPPSQDISGIGPPGIVFNWRPGASNAVGKHTWAPWYLGSFLLTMKTKDARSKKYLSNYLLRSTKVFVGIKTNVNMYILPS